MLENLPVAGLMKAANPRIEETPLFQQHYLGRWAIDDSKLVYRFQQPPAYGTPEWWKQEEEEIWEAKERRILKEREARREEEMLFGWIDWP